MWERCFQIGSCKPCSAIFFGWHIAVEPSSTLNMNEVLIFLVKQAVAGFNFQPSQSATWYDTDKPILFTTWNRQLSQLGLSNFHNLDSPISSTVEMENMVQWSNFVILVVRPVRLCALQLSCFHSHGESSGATAQRFELVVSSLAYMCDAPQICRGNQWETCRGLQCWACQLVPLSVPAVN